MLVPKIVTRTHASRWLCGHGLSQAASNARAGSFGFSFSTNSNEDSVKANILEILRSSGGRINQSGIHSVYQQQFGMKLDPKGLGYKTILKLSEAIPGVSVEPARSANAFPCIVLDSSKNCLQSKRNIGGIENEPSTCANTITADRERIVRVDTHAKLEGITSRWPFDASTTNADGVAAVVAVDCEGEPDDLRLVRVYSGYTYVFDCVELGPEAICHALCHLLTDPQITKVFYDVHRDAVALQNLQNHTSADTCFALEGVFDAQLAMEALTGHCHLGFSDMMREMKLPDVAYDVSLLILAYRSIATKLGKELGPTALDSVKEASIRRVSTSIETGGRRQICFDASNDYQVVSHELLCNVRPEHIHLPSKPVVKHDIEALLPLLPDDCRSIVLSNAADIIDIVLDRDRQPHIWAKGRRIFVQDDPIDHSNIQHIESTVGKFGSDNRSTLEGQVHRISCIRNREGNITGLTLRVGRYVEDVATLVTDIMSSPGNESVLFLGGPGSGKTTVLRDVTRILAETTNVCVIDKSNEIGGDGDVPHSCIGHARRLMVPELDKQADVMIECVQNHTPHCIVVDEIGRTREVFAAETCKNRGVRMVATAHGDLRTLVENKALSKLVGGVETLAIGDAQARRESMLSGVRFNKLRSQRAGRPIFDVVVELQSGSHNECRIVMDPGQAVDDILEGRRYRTHRRRFDPELGRMSFVFEMR